MIPVIFRPFHEASHDSFWWGHSFCSNSEYINLFRYTVDRIKSRCPNVLIAYSPDKNWNTLASSDRYMDRYPGDEYVDILGLDCYGLGNQEAMEKCIHQLSLLSDYANKHNKVVALTETGNNGLKTSKWFCNCLYPVLTAKGVNVAYALVWGSWNSDNGFFVPFRKKGEAANDFKKFVKKKNIYMSKNISKLHLYE